jgi:crossover junction endodeoxyribonuclease RusA
MGVVDGFHLVVPGRPRPKGRPRATAGGAIYTPPQTRAAEKFIHTVWREAGSPRLGDGPWTAQMLFSLENRVWVPDLDNLAKLVLDALVTAGAVPDDRFLARLLVSKEHHPGRNMTYLSVTTLAKENAR